MNVLLKILPLVSCTLSVKKCYSTDNFEGSVLPGGNTLPLKTNTSFSGYSPMSYKKQLIQHLILGKTEAVLKSLTVLADQVGNNLLMNDIVNQYMRFQQLQFDHQAGKITEKDFQFRLKKINQTLILLIEQLPDH